MAALSSWLTGNVLSLLITYKIQQVLSMDEKHRPDIDHPKKYTQDNMLTFMVLEN